MIAKPLTGEHHWLIGRIVDWLIANHYIDTAPTHLTVGVFKNDEGVLMMKINGAPLHCRLLEIEKDNGFMLLFKQGDPLRVPCKHPLFDTLSRFWSLADDWLKYGSFAMPAHWKN